MSGLERDLLVSLSESTRGWLRDRVWLGIGDIRSAAPSTLKHRAASEGHRRLLATLVWQSCLGEWELEVGQFYRDRGLGFREPTVRDGAATILGLPLREEFPPAVRVQGLLSEVILEFRRLSVPSRCALEVLQSARAVVLLRWLGRDVTEPPGDRPK